MDDALQKFTDFWAGIAPKQMPDVGPWAPVVVVAVIGLLYCFVGYRLFKFTLTLTGFLLGGGALALLAAYLFPGRPMGLAIGLLAGGGFGAIVMYRLFRGGVFLVGFLGALVVAYTLLANRPENWVPFAILACGVLGGGAALLLERPVLSVGTAVLGGWIIAVAVALLLDGLGDVSSGAPRETPPWTPYLLLGTWVVFGFMGSMSQLKAAARRRRMIPGV
jgi:hypothetical protein